MYLYKSAIVSWQAISDLIYILNEDTNELHILESVARDIWLEINGSNTIEKIVKIIAGRYDQPYNIVLIDTNVFVGDLIAKSLVTTSAQVAEVMSC